MFQEEQNRIVFKELDQIVAEITWINVEDGVINVNHTIVDPKLRGQKIAEQLVQKVIKKAKNEHLKIQPSCSYVDHYFKKHPEYADLVVPFSL